MSGVYFFGIDAQGIAAVFGTRIFHDLPYYYASIDLVQERDVMRFTSRRCHPGARPVHFEATYRPTGSSFSAESGALSWFLTDRYRYYTQAPDGTIHRAEIRHDPWPLYDVDIEENTLFSATGFEMPDSKPVHFYSPGVDTIASKSKRTIGGS